LQVDCEVTRHLPYVKSSSKQEYLVMCSATMVMSEQHAQYMLLF